MSSWRYSILVSLAHTDHYGLTGEVVADAPAGAQVFKHPFNRPTLEVHAEERDRCTNQRATGYVNPAAHFVSFEGKTGGASPHMKIAKLNRSFA